MRNTARLTALAVLLVVVAGCSIEDDDRDAPRLISVSGEGEVVVAPDRATLALSIAARHKDLAAAQAEADAVVAKLMKVTAGLGIADQKVQTTGIQIQPEFDWRDGKRVALGYLVQRTTTVQLDDLTKLGLFMEQALATGVNEMGPPALSSSRSKELARDALRRAGEDAQRNAEAIADSLGARVGELYSASGQGGGEPPQPMMMRAMAMDAAKVNVAETYSAGEIRVTASVQAQFEIE